MAHSIVLAGSASNTTEVAAFWVLAIVAVLAALGMIMTRRAVHCAVLLAVVMLILAAMYAMQGAPFLAFVQVIVYTGAVLMLFLFVMMIVGITAADSIIETIRGQGVAVGPETLKLAENAALILPLHSQLDRLREEMRAQEGLNTALGGALPVLRAAGMEPVFAISARAGSARNSVGACASRSSALGRSTCRRRTCSAPSLAPPAPAKRAKIRARACRDVATG